MNNNPNKDKLQQEILEKIKEGIKPSDIKKLKNNKVISDIPIAPPLSDKLKKILYSEDDSKNTKQNQTKINPSIENMSSITSQRGSKQKKVIKTKAKVKEISYKIYFNCDSCLETKEGSFKQKSYVKRLVDSPFQLRTHKKLCYICIPCQPYMKEYNEAQD